MSLLKSFVLQTANAPGTGTFSLIAPPTGRRSYASANGAGQVFYEAFDGASFEEGVGTLTTGAPDTLSRDTVTDGTLGAGVKINFASTVQVYSYIPAARALFASADNASVPFGNRVLSAVGPGVAQSDAPRMDQVAWLRIGADVFASSGSVAPFFLDTSKFIKFRLEWTSAAPAAAAGPFCRFSQDGGSTYKQGATDYFDVTATTSSGGSAPAVASGNLSYGPLGATPASGSGAGVSAGWLEIDPNNYVMQAHSVMTSTGGIDIFDAAFAVALTAAPTHVQFGFVGTSVSAARVRLTGWAI